MISKVLDGMINGLRHAVRTIYLGERWSSCSFKQQAWGQVDLTILSQSYAEHLVIKGATAVDIAMSGDDGLRKHYKPHRETTFACNAFETLNLLMLPRASNEKKLVKSGVPIVVEPSGVRRNLQDGSTVALC